MSSTVLAFVNKYCGWVYADQFTKEGLIDLGCSGKMLSSQSQDRKIITFVEASPKAMRNLIEAGLRNRESFTAIDEFGNQEDPKFQLWGPT